MNYILLLIIILFFIYKLSRKVKLKKIIPELKKKGASFIDVRSLSEFQSQSAPNTRNIPLNELSSHLNKINRNAPVILFCATGARSSIARKILLKDGFKEVYNLGSWKNLL